MTKNYILFICGCLLLSSCSIFKDNKKADSEQQKPYETTETGEGNARGTSPQTGTSLAALEKQISGEWYMVSVYNKKITSEEMPFLNFSIADGRVYGNNGCNIINGGFKVTANKGLSFTQMISTMMACPHFKFETQIMRALSEVVGYNFSTQSGVIYLNLTDRLGATVLQLKRHNIDFLNGAWTIKEIHGQKINNPEVKLVIDVQELRLHGNSGCNIINGSVSVDPKKENAVQFQQIISTRKMCPDMKVETSLLVALEEVESAKKKKNSNEVVLYDNKNNPIIVLKRLDLKK